MGYDAASIFMGLSGASAVAPLPSTGEIPRPDGVAHEDRSDREVSAARAPSITMPAPADNAPTPEEASAAASLAARIRAGDAAAESDLVQRYSRGLTCILRRSTGSSAAADDLHQETFRIVIERLRGSGLEQPERLAGFIRRTARNLFLADSRRAVRRRASAFDENVAARDPSPSPLGRVLQRERAQLVRRLVGELRTDRDRQILYRYYLAEEDKDQICHDLGLSDVHFNRVLFRARQRFRELLERSAASGQTLAGETPDPTETVGGETSS